MIVTTSMKAFIVDTDYETIDGKTKVFLFGRLENNQSFISIHDFRPYFFIKNSDLKKCEKLFKKFKVEETSLKDFKENEIIKISGEETAEVNKLYHAIHHLNIDTYEADVKPTQRFLIDNNLLSSLEIEGDFTSSDRVDRIYNSPDIKPVHFEPNLKITSIDIETDQKGNLLCIGIYTNVKTKKNFIVSDKKLDNTVSCKNEEECLEKFRQEIIKIDPDIITGWNLIDFDLAQLQILFKKHKIPFDIGRTNHQIRLRLEENFMKSSSATLTGRQVLDALDLIQDPFIKEAPTIKKAEFESYTLEAVSQEILEKGKLIKGKERHTDIEKYYKENQQKLVDYNLMDCQLVIEILEKTNMIELAIERSQLTGLQMNKLTASIAAFDSLYIREARKKGIVSPTTRYQEKGKKIMGGYVKLPQAGIYHNVLVLDFKSLYPSIMKTFNIDPYSLLDKKEKDSIESPNKAYFRNSEGILPEILDKLHQAREKAKREKRELSNYAIKIIMNSFWGVLASPNCRYFNFEMANSITNFAQMIIKMTAIEIEKEGLKVIYQDTDSIFVTSNLDKDKANILGKKIQENINNFYNKYVKEKYNRNSYLELQFEKQYISLMFPNIRQIKEDEETKAAKKRYAGLIELNGKEKLEITGLEAIRGDWTEAAREFQKELLMKLFHKEPIETFIKEYIKKIKEGKLDKKLLYRKSLRKPLNEYTKTTPPHVKAARLLDVLDSSIVEYYITTEGPEPIQKLKHRLDYDHYIKKQIEPIANQILLLININFKDIESKSKQTKLF